MVFVNYLSNLELIIFYERWLPKLRQLQLQVISQGVFTLKSEDIESILDGKHTGKEISIRGWVKNKRDSKKMLFIIMRDATGLIQCTVKDDSGAWKEVEKLTTESCCEIKGTVSKDDRAPGGYELKISDIKIVGLAERWPINRDKSPEFIMNMRHLAVRQEKLQNVFKIRDEVFRAAREYFRKNKFYETTCPMFVGTRGEDGAEVFELDYFDSKAFLTQTSQMHLEAQIFALEKVFTIAPSFRADKSRTRKHVTEYWHLEAEEAWCELDSTLKTQEELVEYIAHSVAKNRKRELEALGQDPKYLLSIKAPFKKLTYTEAIKILQKMGSEIKWGEDIRTADERLLMSKEKQPVFITHWPRDLKAFYMKQDPKDSRLSLCADLQLPFGYGEVIGGSEREIDYEKIVEKLKSEGDDPKKYEWYLDLRKYGTVPHSGFGLGIARLIMWLCRLEHIRDAIPFPRFVNYVKP